MRLARVAAAKGRRLSQISHGLTGRYRTAGVSAGQSADADLPIRIPAHWLDTLH